MPKCDFNRRTYFPGHLVGKLEVHDGDSGDSVSLHLRGPYARIFKVATNGDLVIDDLDHLNHTETQIIAIARDSGSPPRETSVPVVVRFVGKKLHPKPSLKIGTTNAIYWNSLGLFRD